jgi:hypothetical protein
MEHSTASVPASVRIGGAGGFWGDRTYAPLEMLENSTLDYITIDYLSEVTMSIMAKTIQRDAESGWATDLSRWLEAGGMQLLQQKKVRLVTNAGGVNPSACARAILSIAASIGWHDCRLAVVRGDDILDSLDELAADGESFEHMFNPELGSLMDRSDVVSANVYLGAGGIGRALEQGADIVITGRVADASLIVGCMLHASGWAKRAELGDLSYAGPLTKWSECDEKEALDILAGWTLAGHLIECGAQVAGGNSSDWEKGGPLADIGYPIAIIEPDGTCIITRSPGAGRITRRTVVEQMLYEIGDPSAYHTPDVTLDLSQVTLEQVSDDHVFVSGAHGVKPPVTLKVSATHEDGWFATGHLLVPGPSPLLRAQHLDQTLRGRLSHLDNLKIETEMIGSGASIPEGLRSLLHKEEPFSPAEILVRWGASSMIRSNLNTFAVEIAPLVLTGPAGVSGYGARPRPRQQLAFFPTTVERSKVESSIEIVHIHSWRNRLEERYPWLENRILERLDRLATSDDHRARNRIARAVNSRLSAPHVKKV